MKVLVIGSSNMEITCPVDSSIVEDSTLKLVEQVECGGGNAGNIAYLLGKWGVETYIASMVGSDDAASKIRKEYETIGVKTDYIETTYDRGTSKRIVILNKNNKSKTVLDLVNNAFLKKYSFNIEPDLIISDGNDYSASLAAFDKSPKAMSFLSITDATNEVMEMGKYVNYIILNRKSAEKVSGKVIDFNDSGTIVNVFNTLKQRYSKAEIVITLGERGCIYSINGQVKIMPPAKVEVVDTNGAGSIFVGAFAYAMGRNFGLEKAICYANIAASLSSTKLTARLSIPSLIEVSNYYDSKFGAQNNPNNNQNQNNVQVEAVSTNANVSPTNVDSVNVVKEVNQNIEVQGENNNVNSQNA